ncbi:MAG: TA0938 family protein [Candidatus Lokiarchaeota archaeon]|nr:TA0938 family protein [Candidatus Lokiarchaeota archaeon]
MDENIKVQNLTKFYTLTLLKTKKTVTGYYIIKRLKSDLGKTASPTYIYDFLANLQAEGYILPIPTSKSKRSKGFQLTQLGEDFVDRILQRFGNLIEAAIVSKLQVCASCGVKLFDNFYIETINDKKMNFCCKHCAKAFKNSMQ